MRGAGPARVGDFGLCRAAVGTLVDRPVRALAAGRRAVQNCRVSLPCVTARRSLANLFVKRRGRFAACRLGWLSYHWPGRTAGCHGIYYAIGDSTHTLRVGPHTAGPWDSGRVSRGAWQLVLALTRCPTPPRSRRVMVRHRGRPSCSSAFLLCVRRVSSQLVRPLRGSKSALSVIAISTHRCRHTRGPLFRAVCVFVRAGAFF